MDRQEVLRKITFTGQTIKTFARLFVILLLTGCGSGSGRNSDQVPFNQEDPPTEETPITENTETISPDASIQVKHPFQRINSGSPRFGERDGWISSEPNIINCIDPTASPDRDFARCKAEFPVGTKIELHAHDATDRRWIFAGWEAYTGPPESRKRSSICGMDPICSITVEEDLFLETRWLSFLLDPGSSNEVHILVPFSIPPFESARVMGNASCLVGSDNPGGCIIRHGIGTTVILEAQDMSWVFDGWSVHIGSSTAPDSDLCLTDSKCTFILEDKTFVRTKWKDRNGNPIQ